MKYSELNIKNLTNDDVYDLVMTNIIDYSKQEPNENNNPDFLIVLGCSPIPLEARVIKMMELYKKGYGKDILRSGGMGWHKLYKATKKKFESYSEMYSYTQEKAHKRKEMKKAIKQTVFDKAIDENLKTKKGKSLYKYLNRKYKTALENTEADLAYKMIKASEGVLHIPEEKIHFEPNSINTIQNLEYSKRILDDLQEKRGENKIKRIMIITSSFHCRRAVLSFKKYFPNIDVLSCPATKDIENRKIEFSKESMMNDKYYMQQFKNELDAIISYTRNGSIADANIEDYISDKNVLNRIKRHQGQEIEI